MQTDQEVADKLAKRILYDLSDERCARRAKRCGQHDDEELWLEIIAETAAPILSALTAARASEREACAKIADDFRDVMLNVDLATEPLLWLDGAEHAARDVATAIRSREETSNDPAA